MERFDRRYYDRYYRDPASRAMSPASAARLAQFLHAYLSYLGLPVRRILDIGCGVGYLLRAVARRYPAARVTGIEHSVHACERYGWQRGSVVDFAPAKPYDLVICNDVLPYLDDRDCVKAIANLAALSRGALYLGALTAEDSVGVCDAAHTDLDVHLRPARWYRRHLEREFVTLGGGVFLRRPVGVPLWSLESL
jgi:SAM-dependent methyltransferase